MKKIYIEDCNLYNQTLGVSFKLNDKDIFRLALFDIDKKTYHLYTYKQFFSEKKNIFKKHRVEFDLVKDIINKSFPISEETYNQVLEMDIRIFKSHYKNTFLKLIGLEEMII